MMNNYLSLIKFSHTIFALPFAILGYFLGIHAIGGGFDPQTFILVILCMVFARSAAMAFNRYLDRDIDSKNPRTVEREIPSGIIRPSSALLFTAISSILFIATTYFINPLCFSLSPVALIIVLGYSYTKRFTYLCHLVLGLGLALAPVGAYMAVTGTFALIPILFSLSVLFWVSGFDIIYALQDDEFDRTHQLKSIPSMFGRQKALMIAVGLHIVSSLCVIIASYLAMNAYAGLQIFHWLGVIAFSGLLVYQHTLVKADDLSQVGKAFFTTNGIASVVFACLFIVDFYI